MAGTADIAPTSPSGNDLIDAILWGAQWSSGGAVTTISTAIAGQSGEERVDDGYGATILASVPLEAELAAIAAAMQAIEAVCNLEFRMVPTAGEADLVWASIGEADAYGGLGWVNPPGAGSVSGEPQGLIALNRDAYQPQSGTGVLAMGGYDFCTVLNLLGQAVGLAVPHRPDGSMGFPGADPTFGTEPMNQGIHTMMSYEDGWRSAPQGPTPDTGWGFQAGPMALDIAALQAMYGVDTTYRTGDDTYALPAANRTGTFYSCIWDAGGTDRILGAASLANSIDLRAATLLAGPGGGGFVSYAAAIHGGFTIAWGAVIEDATGGALGDAITGNGVANLLIGLEGDDVLLGLDGDDRLEGGAGNDTLDGGAGNDRLEGGAGDDLYILAGPGDVLVEGAGAGTDTVRAAATHALAANLEHLLLTGGLATNGWGNALANRLVGNGAANVLRGLDGDDALDAAGGDDVLLGGAGADRLLGRAGNDTLDGGAGNDRLEGGAGDDLYILAGPGDVLVEGAGAGTDTVRAAVGLTLGANLERLVLTGGLALNGAGNALANRLTGNAAANALRGLDGADALFGGAGADLLDGGRGHDLLEGGPGRDRLYGGAGNDAFLFARPSAGADVIADFRNVAGDNDAMRISAAGFGGGLVAGTALAAGRFLSRPDNLARDADDRFIFRSTDRTLWFDANGDAAGGPILVADLQAGATLTAADIFLIA